MKSSIGKCYQNDRRKPRKNSISPWDLDESPKPHSPYRNIKSFTETSEVVTGHYLFPVIGQADLQSTPASSKTVLMLSKTNRQSLNNYINQPFGRRRAKSKTCRRKLNYIEEKDQMNTTSTVTSRCSKNMQVDSQEKIPKKQTTLKISHHNLKNQTMKVMAHLDSYLYDYGMRQKKNSQFFQSYHGKSLNSTSMKTQASQVQQNRARYSRRSWKNRCAVDFFKI